MLSRLPRRRKITRRALFVSPGAYDRVANSLEVSGFTL